MSYVALSGARAFMNIGSVPSRATNLTSDVFAAGLSAPGWVGVQEDARQNLAPINQAMANPADTVFSSYDRAVETTSQLYAGDRGAGSDVMSLGFDVLAGSAMAQIARPARIVEAPSGGQSQAIQFDPAINQSLSRAARFAEIAREMGELKLGNGTYAPGSFQSFNPAPGKLADFFENPTAGHLEAQAVLPGGTGRAVAGHGEYNYPIRDTTLPNGTAVTAARPGVRLDEDLGQLMEAGEWDALGRILQNGTAKQQNQLAGMRTYLPGNPITDYTILPPTRFPLPATMVFENSVTVGAPTRLSTMLKEDMGCVVLATCTIGHDSNF